MSVLEGLKPERVFYYFENLCSIPHGSGNTDKISDYCMSVAKGFNLYCVKDKSNNVVIKKKASAGYENKPTVILQGHLDMVCEKESGSNFDFLRDGLDIKIEGDYVTANGTTLGGDDGIAIAMALAILEDDTLPHPDLEVLFTTDEETGMYGAYDFDAFLLDGKMLINIDSEDEGILTVSCAGGGRVDINIPLKSTSVSKKCCKVTLSGLLGGHSGTEINKGRLNSNITLGKFLSTVDKEFFIADISGGLKDNAIPRESSCLICSDADIKGLAENFVKNNKTSFDSGLKITVEDTSFSTAFDYESSKKIADFLSSVINGVQGMSEDIKGLVETSLNLGVLKCENNTLKAEFSVRSSVNSKKQDTIDKLFKTAETFGGTAESRGEYPAWEYKKQSFLRDTFLRVYKNLYGKDMQVEAIHAGLECGLFSDKIAGLDAVSLGPDMCDIHTTEEKLSIPSTKRTYELICEVLKEI